MAKSPDELESMLNDIHLASIPVGISMNLSKTNENAITSTVVVHRNSIEKVSRYVYLGKTVSRVGDFFPEINSVV